MNIFCCCIKEELSKKKKRKSSCILLSVGRLLVILFFDEIIDFVSHRWEERKNFFTNYKMIYPGLNYSTRWKSDCIFFLKNIEKKKTKTWQQEKINFSRKCLKN